MGYERKDARELLARLNPTTIRLDIGSGATGGLTSQDIAAALAFVDPGIGREALIACWWDDSRRAERNVLYHAVRLVGDELRKQSQSVIEAKINLGIAEVCAGWHGVVTKEQRRELERSRHMLELARERCWPLEIGDVLPRMVRAVLDEVRCPRLCSECLGRKTTLDDALVVTCSACDGTGLAQPSERARSRAIGRHVESYRRHWRPVYAFLHRRILQEEQKAAGQLAIALRDR